MLRQASFWGPQQQCSLAEMTCLQSSCSSHCLIWTCAHLSVSLRVETFHYAGAGGQSAQGAVQSAAQGLTTKRVLIGLFLLGPWLVQLADHAGLLHHPESHVAHAVVNLLSAVWALAVVGIALNGGLAHLHSDSPAGQPGCTPAGICLSRSVLQLPAEESCMDQRCPARAASDCQMPNTSN